MTTTGYTKNFVAKNGITTGNITLDAASGNISGGNATLAGDLSVTGISTLGNIGNVKITGGTSGQAIVTDGAGNLSFANASASSSPAPMPTYVAVGDELLISANYQGLFGYPITIDGTMTVDGILIDVNDNGNGGGGGGTATALNANIANVSISGGTSGYYLQTDGAGTLSWAAGGGGGGGSPGGVTTQVQFNDAGSFAGNSGFTFNKTTGIFTSPYLDGNGNGLSNIQGANVSGAVGLATHATTANSVAGSNVSGTVANATYSVTAGTAYSVSAGNISGTVNLANYATVANIVAGANVSGPVSYATTANSVALANVSGAGNVASINLDGSSSNVLYGNGVFAPPSGGGGSYGNSNVATFLASYGSNTITTTGNVSVGNIIGNGQALSGITGANVTGQVSNAIIAGTVTTAAQPNITSTGTLTSVSVSGNANVGNIGAASGVFTANISANNLTTTNKVTAGNGLLVSTGALTVSNGNLDVTGNVNVTGNLNYSNVTDLVVGDPLIYIGANNTGDLYDLGIVGSYNNGTYYHTGLARNHTTDYWTFFDGVVAEPTTVIDWANATYPPVKMGNLIASNANLGNAATSNYFIGNFYGTANLATYATTANAVAGANVSGQVNYAATANAVAGANVSGAVAYATTANSVAGANVSGQVSNALVAGTVYTNAQPNITSVGTLTSLTVSGTSNLGAIGNVTVTGGANGQYLTTNGSGTLSWTTPLTTSIVSGTTQTAVQNYRYVLSNAATTTVTLPSSPSLGDTVYIVVANDLLTNIVARNGQKIMSLDQDMTINSSNAAFGLLYTNSTLGWRVI